MTRPLWLLLTFEGWCTIRVPTDPDPCDEPRGASGYTFAFAGEPDLDRRVRLQPEDAPELLRPGAPWKKWGVFVKQAVLVGDDGSEVEVPEFLGAEVRLLGEPRLENRNWVLTPPGKEPIVPFDLEFKEKGGRQLLRRNAPLKGEAVDFWKKDLKHLLDQAATGITSDPALISTTTGITDGAEKFRQRLVVLKELLDAEKDETKRQCLSSRAYEVNFGIQKMDRRVRSHHAIERFAFEMDGKEVFALPEGLLSTLDLESPWDVSFWIGSWDCDLLGAYFSGRLSVPFKR